MNEIVNTLLLASDNFIPEIHLKQPGFTYSACEPFIKYKERIQKFKGTGDTKYIYRNALDFKNLARRAASDRILRGKVFNIAKKSKI